MHQPSDLDALRLQNASKQTDLVPSKRREEKIKRAVARKAKRKGKRK